MKNIYTIICIPCLAIISLLGCKKDKTFDNVASEKIDANFTNIDSLLTSSANGWKLLVFPNLEKDVGNQGGFSFFVNFSLEDHRVDMLGDFNEKFRQNVQSSNYSLKFTSRTTLSFSTYNYLHELADPDVVISNGKQPGWGQRVDIEYSVLKTSPTQDTIYLMGNLQQTSALLIRASAAEKAYFRDEKKYDETIDKFADATRGKVGMHLNLGNELAVLALSLANKQLTISKEITEDSIFVHRTGITYSGPNEMLLDKPYSFNGINIVRLNVENGKLQAFDSTNKQVEITVRDYPVISATKMFNTGAYSTITVPIGGGIPWAYDPLSGWPHQKETSEFLKDTRLSEVFISLEALTGIGARYNDFQISFKAKQKRLLVTLAIDIFDEDRPGAPKPATNSTPLEYYNRAIFPYQFRYTINTNEVFSINYEGPQYIYASQLPGFKDPFKNALENGEYSLKYTKTATELLVAFYNKRDGEILFEGRPN